MNMDNVIDFEQAKERKKINSVSRNKIDHKNTQYGEKGLLPYKHPCIGVWIFNGEQTTFHENN